MATLKEIYWPDMTALEAAAKAIRQAAITAFFVAGMTALMAVLALAGILRLTSPSSMIDAALFAVIGFFIRRESRVAAICGLALYLLEVIDHLLSGTVGHSGAFPVVVIVFSLFFTNGVRGTFAMARLRKAACGEAPAGA